MPLQIKTIRNNPSVTDIIVDININFAFENARKLTIIAVIKDTKTIKALFDCLSTNSSCASNLLSKYSFFHYLEYYEPLFYYYLHPILELFFLLLKVYYTNNVYLKSSFFTSLIDVS